MIHKIITTEERLHLALMVIYIFRLAMVAPPMMLGLVTWMIGMQQMQAETARISRPIFSEIFYVLMSTTDHPMAFLLIILLWVKMALTRSMPMDSAILTVCLSTWAVIMTSSQVMQASPYMKRSIL